MSVRPEYRILNPVGRGAFGMVYRALGPTGDPVAIKMVELDTECDLDEILNEMNLLRNLKHENITRLLDVHLNDTTLWLCLEYCGAGSCYALLRTFHRFREDAARYVLGECLKAIRYIHKQGMIHRDIKAANVLITSKGEVKLADFGVSAQLTRTLPQRQSFMGTLYWMAPEVIAQRGRYSFPVDIWSLGILAIELVTGKAPLSDFPPSRAMMCIVDGEPPRLSPISSLLVSEQYSYMVGKCLQKNPSKRPTASELLQHRLFCNLKSPPESLLRMISTVLENCGPPKVTEVVAPTCSGLSIGAMDSKFWQFDGERPSKAEPTLEPSTNTVKALGEIGPERQNRIETPSKGPTNSLAVPHWRQINRAEIAALYKKYLDDPLHRVQNRARTKDAVSGVAAVRKYMAQIEPQLPGFSEAFIDELCLAFCSNGDDK